MKRGLTAQIRAFMEEFPFLERYVGNVMWIGEKPTVKRLGLDTIDKCGYRIGYITLYSVFSNCYFLIDSSGKEIKKLRQHEHRRSKSWWSTQYETIPGETIGDALAAIENPDQIKFVLEVYDIHRRGILNDNEADSHFHECAGGLKITIYKLPAGRTLSQWINELNAVAREQLEKELAYIERV